MQSDPPKIVLTPTISDFCAKKDITRYVQKAVDIIYAVFPMIEAIEFVLEQDPEIEDEWLLIDITVDGTAGEILEAYDKYVGLWVSAPPASVRENIKLSYGIS